MSMRLVWLWNMRPVTQFEISQLARINLKMFNDSANDCMQLLYAAIRYAHNNVASLKSSMLDVDSLQIVRYSDAAFINNRKCVSLLGRVILLVDDNANSIPEPYNAYNIEESQGWHYWLEL